MFKKIAVVFGRLAWLVAVLFLTAFIVWSVQFPLASGVVTGAALQLALIVGLFFQRLRQGERLWFVPDEILLFLPYCWALANAGSASIWFDTWKFPLLAVYAVSMLAMPGLKCFFAGGLRANTLLQAITLTVLFVILFVSGLGRFFTSFGEDLYRSSMLNLVVTIAGLAISLAAFQPLVARASRSDSCD